MFNWWSWLTSMIWSFQEVLKGSRISLSRFRKSSPSNMSISSRQRTPSSFWEDQSRDSRMATSPWSSLRSSLTICSKSSRSLERSPQQVSSFKFFQKIRRFSVIVSFIKSIDQRLGKLLWMAQLRDDLKYPVKELSRSLINPQDQDVKNLVHLLKYVNQTRDFVFVMEPQLPVRNQEGKFPVQIVSYSDSDWAGCQKSRRSTSGSLISVFNINLQSTSRTQASIAHSSAESELYAMTQASVESLAIKNFIQEFNSAILSPSVSIVIQTDSSAGKSRLQG